VVLAQDGFVLTNAHVAAGGGPLRVRLPGARVVAGELVGADERTDLAVVRAAATDLPPLALADRRLRVGEVVVAIGNPLGFERSVSLGVVSALYRNLAPGGSAPRGDVLEGLVQTDAAVNPGNSGGPLLDAHGAVVGVTTAMLPWARGIGFAIPATTASWVASTLIHEGAVRRPFLGVAARGEDLEPAAARDLGRSRAVRILEVVAGSPAAEAGLRPGDLVVGAGGSPVETLDDVVRVMVLGLPPELALDVRRGGEPRVLRIRPRPPIARAAA
jgi:S1-C subfamily serine protease